MERILRIKWLFAMTILLTLLGCSSAPTVHINTLYLDKETIQDLQQQLQKSGIQTQINTLDFPDHITSTTIIYSPFAHDKEVVNKVYRVLQQQGLEPGSINELVSANHWYTKNNLGLYVLPDHVSKETISLVKTFESKECDEKTTLTFNADTTFEFHVLGKPSLSGNWSITGYPYVLLENVEPYIYHYFEVKREILTEQLGNVDVISLNPVNGSERLSTCVFVHGTRV